MASSNRVSASSSTPFPDSNNEIGPIYHEVSPKIILGLKVTGGITAFMLLLAFIFCLVQGSRENSNFYLLACNLIISCFVGLVNVYWYRRGDLSKDKFWYMFLLLFIIMFQCVVSDIFVFNAGSPPLIPVSTTTTPMPTITPFTNATHKWSSILPPKTTARMATVPVS